MSSNGTSEKDTKRPSESTDNSEGSKKVKLTKKEAAKHHTRRIQEGFDQNRDDRNIEPHSGSYAHKELQSYLNIGDLDENLFQYPEDAKTTKKKVALLVGFLGTNYGGFQMNVNQRTLQGDIELALYRAGMISASNFGNPHKYSWSSSARTDKGVHAAAQVCSLKVEIMESDLEDDLVAARKRVQERLPSEIQIVDIMRTTRNFCAKTQRDRVRYQYMIPSFLLHPDYKKLLIDHGIPLEGRREIARTPLSPEELNKLRSTLKGYRSSKEQRELLQSAFNKYKGTKPFHNFTKGLKPGQPQADRFIEYFNVQPPVIMANDMEWIPTQVLGQSFLLHQIRKMVSMAIDVTRGAASLEVMDKALSKDETVIVSLAPAQGLFLEMSYFKGYNRRKDKGQKKQEYANLDFEGDASRHARWEALRTKIRKHIGQEEIDQGNFLQYIYQLECLFDYRHMYELESETKPDINCQKA